MFNFAKKVVFLLVFGVLALSLGPREGEAREVQLLMALDISGSMKTTDPLRLLPKSAHIMVELLDEKDSLGILTFEDVTLTRLARGPLSPPHRRKGSQELNRLQPRGLFTDIYQVLAEAQKAFGPPGEAKRALLLISDGQMDIDPLKGNSKTFVERVHQEIIPAYKKAGIPIYTVAFTAASDQVLLKALAEQTGGRFLLISTAGEVHQAFTKFYEDLKGPQVAPLVGNHFVIDAQVQEAILVATRSTQGKAVALESPKGQKINPATKTAGIRWFSAPTFDMVTIPQPEPGKWAVSGHKEGDGRVILMTDLKLECPHLPEEAGLDEALTAGAILINKGQPVTVPEVMSQTVFTAELQAEGGKPVQLPLGITPADQKDLWPAGTRVARFPAFGAPGTWNLKIRALGKTFQRERNITLKVSDPWYKIQPVGGEGSRQVEFLPGPGRKAAQLAGWINISDPAGGMAGKFVQPQPGSSFSFALPSGLSGSYLVNLELAGVTASGRPLFLQPPALRLNLSPTASSSAIGPTSAAAASETGPKGTAAAAEIGLKSAAAALTPGPTGKFARNHKLLLLAALGLVLVAVTLVTVAYVFRPPALAFLILGGSAETITDDMPPEKQNLLLKAQVESLQKEKNKLLADIGEMRQQIDKLTAAKEELEAKMGQPSAEYQEKSKVIKELEQRLEEAEKEAKSVQEEYMALYARSQKEKQVLKKG